MNVTKKPKNDHRYRSKFEAGVDDKYKVKKNILRKEIY